MKTKNLFVISPHHYCHSIATIIEGLNKLDGIKVFSNANHNYCKYPIQTFKTQVQVGKMADYVMLCHSALELKYEKVIGPLITELKDETNIFLDGSDFTKYEADPKDYKLYIKREMIGQAYLPTNNVEPLIFAAEDRHFTKTLNTSHRNLWQNKTDDLVCIMSACEKRPWRFDIMKSLEDAFGHSDKVFIGEYRDGEALKTVDTGDRHFSGYFQKLLSAQISVDSWGCGQARQTGRFWESLANGCLVMYQKIDPYIWPEPFVEDYHFVVYENPTDLVDKAKFYAEHQLDARKIAERGYDYMLRHHTTQARGKQFLSLIDKYL